MPRRNDQQAPRLPWEPGGCKLWVWSMAGQAVNASAFYALYFVPVSATPFTYSV